MGGDVRSIWEYHEPGWWEHREVDAILYWPPSGHRQGWHLTVDGVEQGFVGFQTDHAMTTAQRVIDGEAKFA